MKAEKPIFVRACFSARSIERRPREATILAADSQVRTNGTHPAGDLVPIALNLRGKEARQ